VAIPTTYTGIDTVTVSAAMTGLIPGVRYYYRFEATNAAGVTKPLPLTNVGNPVMPVISSQSASAVTPTTMSLNTVFNAGASNTRISFIYGTDPKLETGTSTINGTPFAIANALTQTVTAALTGLTPNTTYYFRTKVLAYTGPLMDLGGVMYGPIVSVTTPYPPRIAQSIAFSLPMTRFYGGAPTVLSATASSGLPVSFTSVR
jgi:phosphodiesterase/alkaline phosphatase D-like protein